MAVGIKFATKVLLFPDSKGYWIRLVFRQNSIVQGNVMLFDLEHDLVVLMESGADSKPEVVRKGDEMSVSDGYLVTYTKIDGIIFKKSPDQQPSQDTSGDTSQADIAGNGGTQPPIQPLG